jgi:diguanylate cyclase (GGDEF)-like protein
MTTAAPQPELEETISDLSPPASSPHSPPSLPALLVSDGREARKWGVRWLQRGGLEVLCVGAVDEALALLETTPFSVTVVAEKVGSESGLTVCRAAQALASPVPVVFLASSATGAHRALDAGAADVTRAPIDWRAVSRRALTVARSSLLRAELERTTALLRDAEGAAKQARRQIDLLEGVDPLTDLPNRYRFEQLLADSLKALQLGVRRVAVLFLDIDRFKALNDGAGRRVGNEILRQMAGRLRKSLHDCVFVERGHAGVCTAAAGRMSGDEFTVLLTNIEGREHLRRVAEQVLDLLSAPFSVDGKDYFVTASMGIAVAPEDGLEAPLLVQRAEGALRSVQERGGGCRFYEPRLDGSRRRYEIERDLRGALSRGELSLGYQPLVDVRRRRIVGVEALLRWHHRERGLVDCDQFIPVAEESGLIVPIGAWVLRTACEQLRRWLDAGLPAIRLAVNLAICQLVRADMPGLIQQTLRDHRIEPALLELEISERGILREDPEVVRALSRLKEIGVRLSLDDFGTGNSALRYLRQFPIDVLKIDHSYIENMAADDHDAEIASAIIAMAQRLRLSVVAEGVEGEAQLSMLEEWGCDTFQGFLFSPAVPSEELGRLLGAREDGA